MATTTPAKPRADPATGGGAPAASAGGAGAGAAGARALATCASLASLRDQFDARVPAALTLSIVVIGASGDLAKKKTYPALFALFSKGCVFLAAADADDAVADAAGRAERCAAWFCFSSLAPPSLSKQPTNERHQKPKNNTASCPAPCRSSATPARP